jgi:PAS domain S-box-containing protein
MGNIGGRSGPPEGKLQEEHRPHEDEKPEGPRHEDQDLFRAVNERLVISSLREHEHAENEALQRAQLSALLEHVSEGVVIADRVGRIVMINDAARAILSIGEGMPRTVHEFHSMDAEDLRGRPLTSDERPLVRALRGERFTDYEVIRRRPDGEQRRLVSTGTSVQDANGNVALAIVLFHDVTALRRLEQQREEFLALISHDLRSPLSSIVLLVQTLRRFVFDKTGFIDKWQQIVDIVERVERNVVRVNGMLTELTEATSLEAHGVALRRVVYDLRHLVGGAIEGLDDAQARRITLDADDTSPYLVLADAPRLERVVVNLITNALKYSDEDSPVSVRLARKGSDIELAVTDEGIGIPPDSMRMLFVRYYRRPESEGRASGLGLGLYIARLLVEAHGGRIDVSSEVGQGSIFTLTLPSSVAVAATRT